MGDHIKSKMHNCIIKPRVNPIRKRDKVYIGCGAGFGGDRPYAALKLLQRVKVLNYLVLECLAERTLADRYQEMTSGANGFDPRISEWMHLLLPLAMERGTCIITNMGAVDPMGAQERVLEVANSLGLSITVAVAYEVALEPSGPTYKPNTTGGISTYLGAAPIVDCLEKYQPNVIITSRIADAALFLGPMVYELGWDWDELDLLAQGSLAGHLLECGCQLTGGYFMHPADKYRDMLFPHLLDLSLPYAEVCFDGKVCVAKAESSAGVLNIHTCAEQLLYEVGNPAAYITPDVIMDIRDVTFQSLSSNVVQCLGAKPSATSAPDKLLQLVPKDAGWKGWGEISYGGCSCVDRARAAEFLVRSWFEESSPGFGDHVISYIIGVDSLKATTFESLSSSQKAYEDVRLRMDGLFEHKEHASQFAREFIALYTNGPAGGGGISTGHKKEIILEKRLVERESVYWRTGASHSSCTSSINPVGGIGDMKKTQDLPGSTHSHGVKDSAGDSATKLDACPAPSGQKIPLYNVAHSRAGDKGNDLNFSIIPYCPADLERIKSVITLQWVKDAVSPLLNSSSFPDLNSMSRRDRWMNEHVVVEIYEVRGISALNVLVRNILDGGVNCSRRIDRHGKAISDLILSQQVVLPP